MQAECGQGQHQGEDVESEVIVLAAASGNDYQKDKQFRKLNAAKDNIKVKVVRDGQQLLVDNGEVVVGDLLQLDTGDKIVADGITTEFHGLVVDEASLTGESEPVKKGEDDVFCRSGTQAGPPHREIWKELAKYQQSMSLSTPGS